MKFNLSVLLIIAVLMICIAAVLALLFYIPKEAELILPQNAFAYLLDTGTAHSETLSVSDLTRKSGWKIVPEDDITHTFRGDTVFLNDKLIVVLRHSGMGAEVYSRTADGPQKRALLTNCAEGADQAAGIAAIKILENNPGVVMLQVVYQTKGSKNVSAAYRLTTGQSYLEIVPGKGMETLMARIDTRYVLVPDFFGDDIIFSAESFTANRVPLPAENFFLHLVQGGNAMVMCVWQSHHQGARVIFDGPDQRRVIMGSEIQCREDKPVWIAFLEGSHIWHERSISDKDVKKNIMLDWKPPFPAKWRADFVMRDELAESWNFRDGRESESAQGASGEAANCCWFDENRSFVRVPEEQDKGAGSMNFHRSVIVYPIDRDRTTPLTVFCPIDIMRNTLGIGPCQYILEKEGLGEADHPTPDQVTHWVERLFRRKKEKQNAEEIKARLKQMVTHIRHARERIDQYGYFGREIRKLSEKVMPSKAMSDNFAKLIRIADGMKKKVEKKSNTTKPSEKAAASAEIIIAFIGKDNAAAEIQAPVVEIRALGAAQDRLLSQCRMAVRRINLQASLVAAGDPRTVDFAGKVQELAEQMLRKK